MPVKGKHQIFILLCLHFTSVQSDFERVCDSRTELRGSDPNGICGRMIPEMLHLLCGGHYYVPSKRDVSSLSHKQDSNLGKLLGVLNIWIYWTIMKPMNDSIKNSKTRLSNDWYNNWLCVFLEFILIALEYYMPVNGCKVGGFFWHLRNNIITYIKYSV